MLVNVSGKFYFESTGRPLPNLESDPSAYVTASNEFLDRRRLSLHKTTSNASFTCDSPTSVAHDKEKGMLTASSWQLPAANPGASACTTVYEVQVPASNARQMIAELPCGAVLIEVPPNLPQGATLFVQGA